MPKDSLPKFASLLVGAALALSSVAGAADASPRGVRVSDIVKLERFEFDSFRLAPDGSALALGIMRPLNTPRLIPQDVYLPAAALDIDGHARSDIWVQEGPGQPLRNITDGLTDGSGWWDPRWSPDGKRLAMFSTRGGAVAIWIWERSTGALRELTATRKADVRSLYVVGTGSEVNALLHWTDDRHIICSVAISETERYPFGGLLLPLGTELTASPLDSGIPARIDTLPKAEVRVVDVDAGTASVLATEAMPPSGARVHSLSGDGKFLALARLTGLVLPDGNGPITSFEDVRGTYSLEVMSTTGRPLKLDASLPEPLVPNSAQWNERNELLFRAGESGKTADWWLVTSSGKVKKLSKEEGKQRAEATNDAARVEYEKSATKPSERAVLELFSGQNHTAVYQEDSQHGLRVWRVDTRSGKSDQLLHANTQLAGLVAGELRQIEYTSLKGEPLKGAVLLPVGFEEGRKYPVIAWVYAGSLYRNLASQKRAHSLTGERLVRFTPLQLLAAQGYAVLFPSMPLKESPLAGGSEPDDPLLRLTEGVLPAIDKLVNAGIADGRRVFVMGHSFGGYSTYGLVTQTDRFRAAVALNGLTDMVSRYGTFDARKRYLDVAHQRQAIIGALEISQGHMGNPPWKDFDRYYRNSPINFVDRVHTPLLMIATDLDFVPLQQAEQFFTALFRQGKRAQLVRYWGEEHTVAVSAANVLDMWARILAWFDEFGDISRDAEGRMLFDGDRAKSRDGMPALTVADVKKLQGW